MYASPRAWVFILFLRLRVHDVKFRTEQRHRAAVGADRNWLRTWGLLQSCRERVVKFCSLKLKATRY